MPRVRHHLESPFWCEHNSEWKLCCVRLELIDQFGCASTNNSAASTRFLRLVKLKFGANGSAVGAEVHVQVPQQTLSSSLVAGGV